VNLIYFFFKPIPDPLPRPDASEYEEFKDYEHVGTVGDDQDSEKVIMHNKDLCNENSKSSGFHKIASRQTSIT
jgi:hypothetical protein